MEKIEVGVASESTKVTTIPSVTAGTEQGAAPATAPILAGGETEGGKAGKGGNSVAAVVGSPPSPPLGDEAAKTPVKDQTGQAEKASVGDSEEDQSPSGLDDELLVYIEKLPVSPVVVKLKERGLYRRNLGNGSHEIVCPSSEANAPGENSMAIYIEPDAAHPLGQLFCRHSHEKFNVRDFLTALGVSCAAARNRSIIRVFPGEMTAALQAIETELAISGKFFHMGGTLVMLLTDTMGVVSVAPVSEQMLTQKLAALCDWEKPSPGGKYLVRCDPAQRLVNMLFHRRDYKLLPELKGVARQPFFGAAKDGVPILVKKSGYDKASSLYCVFRGQDYDLPVASLDAAKVAMALILDLVSEFHFVAPVDRAVAISAMFTAVFRPSIRLAPGFHMRAPVIASGKSLLCDVIGGFAGPDGNKKVSYPRKSDEATKVILSALLTAPAVLEFDDMDSDWIPHGVVNRMFTSEQIAERILGYSKMATVGTRTLVLGSGNNVGPIRDLTRRVMTCHLDPRCAIPAELVYNKNPVEMIRNARSKYVGAVLTVVQAWFAAGSPKSDVQNIASFGGEWADLCRHPLIWMGLADPAASFFDQLKNDPDVENLGRLLKAWEKVFGSLETTVREVSQALDRNEYLKDAVSEFPAMERDGLNPSKFGWFLKRSANRIVDGLMFERVEGSERTAWKVVRVGETTTKSPALPPLPALNDQVPKEPAFGNLTAFEAQLQSDADAIDGPSTPTNGVTGTDGHAIAF